jgi:hypothetical protein
MQIFAGSFNVQGNAFLHAGYLSAYPRTFARQGAYELQEKTAQTIDVKKALELKETGKPAILAPSSFTAKATSVEGPIDIPFIMLLVVFIFFTFVYSLYFRQMWKMDRPKWRSLRAGSDERGLGIRPATTHSLEWLRRGQSHGSGLSQPPPS